jgi:hypothetical protein
MKELMQLIRGLICGIVAVLLFGGVIVRIRIFDSRLEYNCRGLHRRREFS